MTAKKRARNRNKKAAAAQAADTEKRPSTPTSTTSAIVSPEADMCVHGLNLEYSNEDLKQTVKDLCDDAASDVEKVERVIYGNIPRSVRDGKVTDVTSALETMLEKFLHLSSQDDSEEETLNEFGISTILLFKYPEEDIIYIDWMISHFVSEGTKCLLRGDVQTSRGYAFYTNYFEQIMKVGEKGGMMNVPKLVKFHTADEHTLCSYFRNRIPCSCLDKKYKEVKSVVKKDMCWNANCKQPNRFEIDSESMLTCSGCRQACYCSSECQEIDWRARHKMTCGLCRDATHWNREAVTKMMLVQDSDALDIKSLLKETLSTVTQAGSRSISSLRESAKEKRKRASNKQD